MVVAQYRNPSRFDIELEAFGKRQANPTRDEATIEVAVSDNHNVSGSLGLLFPLPMIFTNLTGDTVNASCHIFG